MSKMRKRTGLLLLMITCLCLFTGCHGSKGQNEFEIPEKFDTSGNYEITS